MKILIVDDSVTARMILKRSIPLDRNYELIEASDGEAGLMLFERIVPDIVFLDLTMPKMDGFEALKRMKEQSPSSRIYIISADSQDKSRERVEALGANGFIKKMIDPEEIRSLLDQVEKELNRAHG